MGNFKPWTIDDFPKTPWTKPQLEAWESAASEGEKKALGQAYVEYKEWRTNPDQGWFGKSINPSVCQGKLVEVANKYHAWLPALSYKYMREYM